MSPQSIIERDARMLVRAYGFQAAVQQADDRLYGFIRDDDGDRVSYWRAVRSAIVEIYAGVH